MIDKLVKRARRRPVFEPTETTQVVEIGRADIERMLPHREPFLLLDGIDRVDLEVGAVRGHRVVPADDPVFTGHFPGAPVYPGVLCVEMIGQMGICLQHLLSTGAPTPAPGDTPRPVRLIKVQHATFLGAVGPGDTVTLIVKALDAGDYTSTSIGQALVDGAVKALAVFEVFLLDSEED